MAKGKAIYTPTKPKSRYAGSKRSRSSRGSGRSVASSVKRAAISAAASMVPGGPVVQKAVEYAANSIVNSMSRRGSDASMMSSVSSGSSKTVPALYFKGLKFGTSTGRYRGNFKKPRRTSKPKIETMCLQNGFHSTVETYGTLSDAHCGYIAHSTFDLNGYVAGICGALLRKLLKKGGITVDDRHQEIPFYDYGNSDGFKISYQVYSPTDLGFVHYEFITANNQSLQIILDNFTDFTSHISQYIRDITSLEPWGFQLYSSDRNVTDTNWRLAASLNLQQEKITLFSTSKIVVQNRTSGDQAGREGADPDEKFQLDRVDNTPLVGYIYEFKNGDPRLRNQQIIPAVPQLRKLNAISQIGLQLTKASVLANTGKDYQEPPVPKFWGNISKSSRVILQPGDQKSHSLFFKASGKLLTVLKYLRVEQYNGATAEGLCSGVAGRSAIIALEEKIRSVTTNPIVMVYECEKKIGVMTKSTKPGPMLSYVEERNVSEV